MNLSLNNNTKGNISYQEGTPDWKDKIHREGTEKLRGNRSEEEGEEGKRNRGSD